MGYMEELVGLIKELGTGLNSIKEKQDVMEAQIASFKEGVARGLILPNGTVADPTAQEMDMKEFAGRFDMSKQGKRLMDSAFHRHVIDESTRLEMAKFYCLFIRAAIQQDPVAYAKFREEYKSTTTDIGDAGNIFPIPDIVDSEILTYARESSVILQFARQWDMTSDTQSFPAETGASATAWGNTTQELAPTIGEVELKADELSAYATVKNATMADARSDIVSWLTESFAEAIGQALDSAAFIGDGNGTYGGVSGLLSAKCGKSVIMTGSQSFGMISATHLSNMIGQLDGLRKQGGRFYMNGAIMHFVRNMRDNNNGLIFQPTVGSPVSGTIWGYPWQEVIVMPSSSAANTAFVAFGNLRYFAIGKRLQASALQVDPYGLWTTNRTRFKVYNRWALNMAMPNAFCRLLTAP